MVVSKASRSFEPHGSFEVIHRHHPIICVGACFVEKETESTRRGGEGRGRGAPIARALPSS
jgi:hypothetical protein